MLAAWPAPWRAKTFRNMLAVRISAGKKLSLDQHVRPPRSSRTSSPAWSNSRKFSRDARRQAGPMASCWAAGTMAPPSVLLTGCAKWKCTTWISGWATRPRTGRMTTWRGISQSCSPLSLSGLNHWLIAAPSWHGLPAAGPRCVNGPVSLVAQPP